MRNAEYFSKEWLQQWHALQREHKVPTIEILGLGLYLSCKTYQIQLYKVNLKPKRNNQLSTPKLASF